MLKKIRSFFARKSKKIKASPGNNNVVDESPNTTKVETTRNEDECSLRAESPRVTRHLELILNDQQYLNRRTGVTTEELQGDVERLENVIFVKMLRDYGLD